MGAITKPVHCAPQSIRPRQRRSARTAFPRRLTFFGTRCNLERETGFEPATPSLEGWRSTAELFPHFSIPSHAVVGRGGFEPPKAFASRFPVCPLWPLGYLPESAGMRREAPSRI